MQNLRRWTARLSRVLVPAGMYLMLASFSPAAAAPEPVASPLARLRAGNERFVRGAEGAVLPAAETRRTMAGEEHPFAMVLSCADSRVPPELVFGAGPGDLYVVRTLGQVPDRAVLASLDAREQLLGPINDIEAQSADPYATIKRIYTANRRNDIKDGAIDVQALPDFDSSFEPSEAPPIADAAPASGTGAPR